MENNGNIINTSNMNRQERNAIGIMRAFESTGDLHLKTGVRITSSADFIKESIIRAFKETANYYLYENKLKIKFIPFPFDEDDELFIKKN